MNNALFVMKIQPFNIKINLYSKSISIKLLTIVRFPHTFQRKFSLLKFSFTNYFTILKEENVYEWNTAQNEPIIILMLGLLESMLSKSNINIILLFHRKIHSYTRK